MGGLGMLNKNDKEIKTEFSNLIRSLGMEVSERALKPSIKNTEENLKQKLIELSKEVKTEFEEINQNIDQRLEKQSEFLNKMDEKGKNLKELFYNTEEILVSMERLESTTKIVEIIEEIEKEINAVSTTYKNVMDTIDFKKEELIEYKSKLTNAIDEFTEYTEVIKNNNKNTIDERKQIMNSIQEYIENANEDCKRNIKKYMKDFNEELKQDQEDNSDNICKLMDEQKQNFKNYEENNINSLNEISDEITNYIKDDKEDKEVIKNNINQIDKQVSTTLKYSIFTNLIFAIVVVLLLLFNLNIF